MGRRDGDVGLDSPDIPGPLPLDDRETGRRRPVLFPKNEEGGPVLREGEGARVDRNDVGAVGFDSRRRSLRSRSLSFAGDGESSMIRTHPDSPVSFLECLSKLSELCLDGSGLGR